MTPFVSRRLALKGLGYWAGATAVFKTIPATASSIALAPESTYSARAVALVASTHVIDMLCELEQARVVKGGPNSLPDVFERMARWNRDPKAISDEQLRRYRESGINTYNSAPELKFYDPKMPPYERADLYLRNWGRIFKERPEVFSLVLDGESLARVPDVGRLGVILGIQNGDHFRTAEDVEHFHNLGLRVSQLTYNDENHLGGGAFTDIGLKPAGREIIRAMNRSGIAVDLAHASNRLAYEAAEACEISPIISHTNCQALTPGFLRNASDDVIRAVARRGGVVGLTVLRQFVSLKEPTTINDYILHIDHIANLVGIEYVGLGSDNDLTPFDGVDDETRKKYFSQPAQKGYQWRERVGIDGLDHHRRVYDITDALLKRNYSEKSIRLVLGGNFQRVLSLIWASRASLPSAPSQPTGT